MIFWQTDIIMGKKSDLEKQNKRLDRKISKLQKTLEYFKSKYPELII